ncbi:MAG: hypothetical protein KDC87_07545 [Planctomycetes bacterium]|nr:hypothetical protein [Planctomycetota bacterium]
MQRVPLDLVLLTLAALALRVAWLGFSFHSSDEVELAHRILVHDGWGWMVEEPYGLWISLLGKLSALAVASLGIPLTEFWWRLPIAVAGAALVPVAHAGMRGLGCTPRAARVAAGCAAVFPIHVFHSRYLWGYEVLGALGAVCAITTLVRFFALPTRRRGLLAGSASAAYLLSHGYILPFFAVLLALPALLGPGEGAGPAAIWRRFLAGATLYVTRGVLVPIVLAAPIYQFAIRHAFEKRTRFGPFIWPYCVEILQNVGWLLLVPTVVALAWFGVEAVRRRVSHDDRTLVLGGVAASYLLPIFLMVPPGITLTRNYLLIGPLFAVLAAVAFLDSRGVWARAGARTTAATALVLVGTGWGAFESYFSLDRWLDPSAVRWERGALYPDPGTKAIGYLMRRLVPPGAHVLFVHRRMEIPNVDYYVGFAHATRAFNDRSLRRSRSDFALSRGWADYVVLDPEQRSFCARDLDFEPCLELRAGGELRALVYAKSGRRLDLAAMPGAPESWLREWNACFDREIASGIGDAVLGRAGVGNGVPTAAPR